MATVYYDDEADLGLIQSRKIAVLGYGSQGHAHALSLHDSGCDVRVGLPEGSKSLPKAQEAGLTVGTPEQVCAWADLVMVLTPDTGQRHLYAEAIAPSEPTREAMAKILTDIRSGDFAREWIAEDDAGRPNFERLRKEASTSQVERVGRPLRRMMSWLDAPTDHEETG